MERYLITQSLLNAWNYMFSCREDNEEAAKQDFLQALNRIPIEETKEMVCGKAFEQEVYTAATGLPRTPHPEWEPGIQQIASIIRGAAIQVRQSREIEIAGNVFLVYGILDALKAGTIYDIKFCSKPFKDVELTGKYMESPQHPAYFYIVPEAADFQYLVSDGADLYIERYLRNDTPYIGNAIAEFMQFLDSAGLMDTYKEKWLAK